ncbi:DUF397 domain-containing protein [Nocardia nova]|uniref:DUF397 domain-containing protein n=1 Tax=Nocardia nova TaxID=37330 RepID=UPI0033F0FCB3
MTGARWFKSSLSHHGSDCVEVAHLGGGAVGVRDSKDRTGPALVFAPGDWDAFIAGIQAGRIG